MHMDLIQNDEVTQVKGIVRIMYEVGRTFAQIRSQGSFKDRIDSIRMYQECLPIRVASLHFCMKEATVSAVVNLFLKLTNKEMRIRSRVHFGKSPTRRKFLCQMMASILQLAATGGSSPQIFYLHRHFLPSSPTIQHRRSC